VLNGQSRSLITVWLEVRGLPAHQFQGLTGHVRATRWFARRDGGGKIDLTIRNRKSRLD
jgi:hypothetical protein